MFQISFLTSLTDVELDGDNPEDDDSITLNNAGVIVGSSTSDAVQWINATPSILWRNGVAYAINDAGEIVGYQQSSTGTEAVTWIGGTVSPLASAGSGFYSMATAVNKSGMVIGEALSNDANLTNEGALIWNNGQVTKLDASINLNALNDAGQAVGAIQISASVRQGYSWTSNGGTTLSPLASGDSSVALALNNSGVIVGGDNSDATHQNAVMWQNGKITALPTLSGDSYTFATGINDAGIIVGEAEIKGVLGSDRAVMWVDGQVIDLNSLLPANSGWTLYYANAINNDNQILGYGGINGVGADFILTLGTGTAQIGMSAEVVATSMPTAAVAVLDSAADITHYLDALQRVATAGVLGSITLTDGGIPNLTVTQAQWTADAAVLGDIDGPHTVTVTIAGDAAQHNFSADTLAGVSALQFDDQTVIVAAMPGPASAVTTGNITELYAAVLGREPDLGGLAFYQNFLKTNPATGLQTFADYFLNSTEYKSAHSYAAGTAGDTQFITDSYQNLLHRTPSSDEVNFYLTNVMSKPDAHALMLVYFSASTEFLKDVQITAANPASAQHWLILT